MATIPASILFACTRNIIRSPMAEAMMKQLHGTRVFVDSVGVEHEEAGADPFAIEVMREIGLDISGHRPMAFDDLDDMSFDLIVTFTPEARARAEALTRAMACEVVYWPTVDPTLVVGNRTTLLAAYREVRDAIGACLEREFPALPASSG